MGGCILPRFGFRVLRDCSLTLRSRAASAATSGLSVWGPTDKAAGLHEGICVHDKGAAYPPI